MQSQFEFGDSSTVTQSFTVNAANDVNMPMITIEADKVTNYHTSSDKEDNEYYARLFIKDEGPIKFSSFEAKHLWDTITKIRKKNK